MEELEGVLGDATCRAGDFDVVVAVSGSDPAAACTDTGTNVTPLTALVLSL